MVVRFVGTECIVGFMEVEFMVVHVSINAHVLTKSAYLGKTRYSQSCLLWSIFEPRAQGVACPR